MPLVLTTHSLHPDAAAVITAAGALKVASCLDTACLIGEAMDADVIIVRAPLPAELFGRAPRLRAAIRHGAGIDMIPVAAATEAGVLVANVPGSNARSVAEHVILSALALSRRFCHVGQTLADRGWFAAREYASTTSEISGKTIGLVGMGHVGGEIYKLAQAFDMRVLAHKPSPSGIPSGVEYMSLNTLVRTSDFVVLCCPLTTQTRGLINGRLLASMKRTAFIINVARGAVVVEEDLLNALDNDRIAGAALDVFSEQPLAVNHPFLDRENVLLTPHMAGITNESMQRMGLGAAREALRVLSNRLPQNLINPEAVSAYRTRFAGEELPALR